MSRELCAPAALVAFLEQNRLKEKVLLAVLAVAVLLICCLLYITKLRSVLEDGTVHLAYSNIHSLWLHHRPAPGVRHASRATVGAAG